MSKGLDILAKRARRVATSGRKLTAVGVCVTVMAAALTPAAAQAAPVSSCGSTFSGTSLAGPVEVPAGNTCTLVNVTVTGGGQVTVDGRLVATNSSFSGALTAHRGASIELNGGKVTGSFLAQGPGTTVILNGGHIGGALNLEGPGVGGQMTCPVSVDGAVAMQESAVGVTGSGCSFGAALRVAKVPLGTAVSFVGVTVGGTIMLTENSTEIDLGPLKGNGALICLRNVVPPVGVGPVSVKGAMVGQCSGIGSTTPRPAGVSGPLSRALLTLSPPSAGPEVVGGTQKLTATLSSPTGPIAGQLIGFALHGANPSSGTATTDEHGVATFTYTGRAAGTDHAQASAVSPGGTIYSNASQVRWVSLATARLLLAPANIPNDVVGTTQVLTATLTAAGQPVAGQPVQFVVTGANSASGTSTTGADGSATFSYLGSNAGTDTAVAKASGGGSSVSSAPSKITWTQPVVANVTNPEGVSTTPVQGNFFAEPASSKTFVAKPGDTPAFGQTFPNVEFDPPAGTVNGEPPSGPSPATRPFTDVTTDQAGGFSGTIPAIGNGFAAGQTTGTGDLTTFNASFTGSLNVAKAQDLTLQVIADDGYLLGVGGGATPVNPTIVGTTATTTPFKGYPLSGAYDQPGTGSPATYQVIVHLPAAGTYPYELDYLSCCDKSLSLTLGVVTSAPVPPQPYNLFAGYADNTRPGAGANFPNPWQGAPNSTFVGSGAPFDTGGLRFDNTTTKPLTVSALSVDIGSHHFTPTTGPQTVPPGGKLIVAGTNGNFDTSEAVAAARSIRNGSVPNGTVQNGTVQNGAPGGGTGQNGFATQAFATDFPTNGTLGPIGVTFDSSGRLYVAGYADGNLYRFGPSGGAAAANKLSTTPIGVTLAGMTFSKAGRLYALIQNQRAVVELDPATGAVLRTVETGQGTCDLQTDPISGDLFVSECGGALIRISHFEDAGPVTTSVYGPGADGFVFGPDGTIYESSGLIRELAATNTTPPAAVTNITNSGPGPVDGIALINPPAGQPVTKLAVNRNDGIITEVDFSNLATPVLTDIVTRGTRGDFVTTGPDGCLYATQTAMVEKVTSADGSCPFVPPPACNPSLTAPIVHVTVNGTAVSYPDTKLSLTAGGKDGEVCGTNESQPWQQLAGLAASAATPLPPAVSLLLSPAVSRDNLVSSSQTLKVSAADQAGHPAVNVAVTLAVSGANPQVVSGTTDATGAISFSYRGVHPGTDTASASAVVAGAAAFSNDASIGWTIPVPPPPPPPPAGQSPPVVTITAPTNGQTIAGSVAVTAVINPPAVSPIASWTVAAQPSGGGAPVALASGTGNPPSQLATLDPAKLAVGSYSIIVGATTKAGASASAAVAVIVGTGGSGPGGGGGTPGQAPPSIANISPTDGSVLTTATPVTAAVTPPAGQTIASWSAGYHPASSPLLIALGSGSGPPSATLGNFDPTLLPDDTYLLQITATASGGGVATAAVSVAVAAALKPGRYVTIFKDLSIPVAGFTADVTRVYDSFDKSVGDFGVGWHLGASDYKVSVNTPLGAGGWSAAPSSCSLFGCTYVFVTAAPHYATVTFPDGHQEMFDLTPAGGFGPFFFFGSSAFTARKGTQTTSSLAVDPASDPGPVFGFDGNLYAGLGGASYNPTRFVLTRPNGTKLLLDESTGLVSETDPHGNTVSFDAAGIHATNAGGTVEPGISFTRDGQGRIIQVTGPTSQKLTYTYSPAGDLASVTDPVGNVTTFSYDANHNLVKTTGPGGPLHTYTYDAAGRLTSITDANGNVTKVANNVAGAQQVITDPLGVLTTVLTFDAEGNITSTQQSTGGVSRTTTRTYDTLGDVTSTGDPLGETTFATFDTKGNQTSSTDALGYTATATFGPMDEVLSRSDALGRTTTAVYDTAGDLTMLSEPGGATIQLTYDANGSAASVIDPLGHAYTVVANPAGQPASITDPLSHVLAFGYDSSGNRTSVTDPINAGSGRATTIAYDAANRQISSTDPLGHVNKTSYDGLGDIASTTTANGNVTTNTYDLAQQQIQITGPNGSTVKLTYDANGRQTSVTDPDGHLRRVTYDGFGEKTSSADPATGTTTFIYDAAGRLTSSSDARGITVTSSYDADSRLITRTAPGESSTRTYDSAGELTSLADPTGITTNTYDVNGRITSVASPEGTIAYSYDTNGDRTTMTLPGSKVIEYSYDADSNLIGQSGLGQTVGLTYNADNHLATITRPNGVTTTYGYDAASRPTSVVSVHGATILTSFVYARDADGNPTSVATPAGTTAYSYDNQDRLLSGTGGVAPGQSFTYDAAGNITSVTSGGTTRTYTYDAGGRLTSAGPVLVQSDAAGNTTKVGSDTFDWDAFGRLRSSTVGGAAGTYTYDANNLRVATTGPTTTDLWDPVDPTTGKLAALPQLVSDGTNTYLVAAGQTLGQIAGGTASYYLADALGSVQATSGSAGTLASTTTYAPYGTIVAQTGTAVSHGFTGQIQDPTGLVFLRARYLHPAIGRFLSADDVQPNGQGTGGYNQYIYGNDDPLVAVDPSGHNGEDAANKELTALRVRLLFLGYKLAKLAPGSVPVSGSYAYVVYKEYLLIEKAILIVTGKIPQGL